MTIRTYSPVLDAWGGPWQTEPVTLPMDFSAAASTYRNEGVVDPVGSPSRARVRVPVTQGVEYEWYVTVDDCNHVVKSPVWTFRAE